MRRPKIPKTLPIIAVIFLIIGAIAWRAWPSITTEEQLASNVLLAAIPFVLIFVGILLLYITLIVIAVRAMNDIIKAKTYNRIMWVIIAGILLGILGMFQPWAIQIYTIGFIVLLISLLSYILWSHIAPYQEPYVAEDQLITLDTNAV